MKGYQPVNLTHKVYGLTSTNGSLVQRLGFLTVYEKARVRLPYEPLLFLKIECDTLVWSGLGPCTFTAEVRGWNSLCVAFIQDINWFEKRNAHKVKNVSC